LKALRDENPLVREQAARSLEPALTLDDSDVASELRMMLADPVRDVRVAAAWTLRRSLDTNSEAGKDLQRMFDCNGDQPVGQFRIAMFHLDRGEPANALPHLLTAETWDPFSPPFRLAAADVLTELGRTNEAERELQILREQTNSPAAR
jgi:hypothetical protein